MQRLHLDEDGNVLMQDETPLAGGRAVIIQFRELIPVGGAGEKIQARESDGQFGIILNDVFFPIDTDNAPIWFIPDGFTALVNRGRIDLFSEANELIFTGIDEYATRSSTIYGHANASGAIAVGAMSYLACTLVFG